MEKLTTKQVDTLSQQPGFNFILPGAKRTVNSLISRGYLKRDKDGYYWITQDGIAALDRAA